MDFFDAYVTADVPVVLSFSAKSYCGFATLNGACDRSLEYYAQFRVSV